MARIFSYKGKTAEQLQAMSLDDFSKLIKSRPRRAIKRMSASLKSLIALAEEAKKSGKNKLRTHTREAVIIPAWIGMTIAVYDGKAYKYVPITVEIVGHRLGDFAHTTKHVQHSAPGIRATRGSKFLAVK